MTQTAELVVFRLEAQRYALRLGVVERIIHAVEVTALPQAPAIVMGVIDIEGRVLPVLNIRRRFHLPEQNIGLDTQFLIARISDFAIPRSTGGNNREVALVVDEVQGLIEIPSSQIIAAGQIVPGLEHVQGVIKLDGGLVLIHDLDTFLSLDEARELDQAMQREVAHGT